MININHLSKYSPVSGHRNALFLPLFPFSVIDPSIMSIPVPTPSSAVAAETAVLLILLPPAGTAKPVRAATLAAIQVLQQRLGSVIRVLLVDEDDHPTVVRSFQPADLPAFVLVRQGVELWSQRGLPEDEFIVPQLLARLAG